MIRKILNKLTLGFFFKNKIKLDFNYPFAVIRTTDAGLNSNINDKFNKKISIFNSWNHYLNNMPISEIPYTEADANNIEKIFEMPLIFEDLDTQIDFVQGEPFGEVKNIIR